MKDAPFALQQVSHNGHTRAHWNARVAVSSDANRVVIAGGYDVHIQQLQLGNQGGHVRVLEGVYPELAVSE